MKLGLKLWSINTDHYYQEAKRLYKQGVFDYIELYVVPNTLEHIVKWKELDIPFTLHAPHFMHGVNLAEVSKFEYNSKIFLEVEEYRKGLNAKYTVIHSGMNGDIKETVRQLNIIKPVNALIENKPYKAPLKPRLLCRGATIEEIKYVLESTDCGFCLDISHAICTANSVDIAPYKYLEKFQKLEPKTYHLSGNFINSVNDCHMHLYEGNYDYSEIFKIIDKNQAIAIETKKDSIENLEDFIKDINIISNRL